MTLIRCIHCNGNHLDVFMELIDWDEGDDSQAWMRIPLTEQESQKLKNAGAENAEKALVELQLNRKHLFRSHPKGGATQLFWRDGEVLILPHD